jgi:seryl-tRNA synthetase
MLDPKLLRESPDTVAESLRRRGLEVDLGALIDLDAAQREALQEAEQLRSRQKEAGKEIAALEGEAKEKAIAEVSGLADSVKEAMARADELAEEFRLAWLEVPNLVDPSAADGYSEEDNLEIKRFGDSLTEGTDHASLGESLDIIDTERAAKVSGSRFGYLKGKGALLELSLVRWAMDHLYESGFTPMIPPVLVREHALEGTGFFPEAREQVYEIPRDELFLVGTSEVPLAAYHGDEILDADDLPLRYAGFSTCFRREAGTYGKDTAGIFRVHQFDKVEMFVFTTPEASNDEHDRLLGVEEHLVQELDIPYRVVNVAAGDLGASAARNTTSRPGSPGNRPSGRSLPVRTPPTTRRGGSGSATGRRGAIPSSHTLNGTACAVGRTILAILENHQQPDGSVMIPEALRRYTGFDVIEP